MSDYAVVNPATGETLATYPHATDAELDGALAAADAAAKGWARTTTVAERASLLRKVAELHRERRNDLAAIIVREMGKTLAGSLGEVDFAADITEFYADNAERIMKDQPIDILGEGTAVSAGRRWARCWASCRGTIPTTRSPASRLRTC